MRILVGVELVTKAMAIQRVPHEQRRTEADTKVQDQGTSALNRPRPQGDARLRGATEQRRTKVQDQGTSALSRPRHQGNAHLRGVTAQRRTKVQDHGTSALDRTHHPEQRRTKV